MDGFGVPDSINWLPELINRRNSGKLLEQIGKLDRDRKSNCLKVLFIKLFSYLRSCFDILASILGGMAHEN